MSSDSAPDFELFTSLRYDPQLKTCPPNTTINGSPSPYYMLPYHRDRILEAASHFRWSKVVFLLSGQKGLRWMQNLIDERIASDITADGPKRVRFAVNIEGSANIQIGILPTISYYLSNLYPMTLLTPDMATDGPAAKTNAGAGIPGRPSTGPWVVIPDTAHTVKSAFSTFKTSQRGIYDDARSRAGIESFAEPKEVLLINEEAEIMEGSLTSIILWRGGRWVTPPVSSGGQKGTTRRWLLENGLVVEDVLSDSSLRDGEDVWLSNGVRGMIFGRIKLGGEQSSTHD